MTDPLPAEEATLFPKTAGERLREAREAQGLALAEIAARTRVPVRQLEAIEESNYGVLPSITYSVGFAKAYARVVGLDEASIARDVRGANDQPTVVRRTDYEPYAIDETEARGPGRGLVIATAIIAVLLVIGVGIWYGTTLFRGEGETAPAPAAPVATTVPEAPVVAPTAAAQTGQVSLTAASEVWLRVYDGTGKTLFIGTLKAGDHYDVPADAADPMINVGRPDQLQVTIGGAPVASLGDGRIAIKDVRIGAAALTARGTPAAAVAPSTQTDASAPSRRAATPTRERRAAPSSGALLNIAAPAPETPAPAPTATGAATTP